MSCLNVREEIQVLKNKTKMLKFLFLPCFVPSHFEQREPEELVLPVSIPSQGHRCHIKAPWNWMDVEVKRSGGSAESQRVSLQSPGFTGAASPDRFVMEKTRWHDIRWNQAALETKRGKLKHQQAMHFNVKHAVGRMLWEEKRDRKREK